MEDDIVHAPMIPNKPGSFSTFSTWSSSKSKTLEENGIQLRNDLHNSFWPPAFSKGLSIWTRRWIWWQLCRMLKDVNQQIWDIINKWNATVKYGKINQQIWDIIKTLPTNAQNCWVPWKRKLSHVGIEVFVQKESSQKIGTSQKAKQWNSFASR